MSRISTRLLTFLLTSFVLLSGQAFAHASYFCHMTGEVSASCCCTGKHAHDSRDAKLQARDCCELREAPASTVTPATSAAAQQAAPAAVLLAVLPTSELLASSAAHARAPLPRAHPPGPPLFVTHCVFLI